MIHIFGNLGWQKARVRFQLWADCVPSICARRTGRQKFKSSIKKLRHLKTAALKCSKPAVSHEGQAPKATAPVVTKARIPLSVKLDEGHKPMVSGPAVEAVDTGTGQRSNASIYVDITGTSGIHPSADNTISPGLRLSSHASIRKRNEDTDTHASMPTPRHANKHTHTHMDTRL